METFNEKRIITVRDRRRQSMTSDTLICAILGLLTNGKGYEFVPSDQASTTPTWHRSANHAVVATINAVCYIIAKCLGYLKRHVAVYGSGVTHVPRGATLILPFARDVYNTRRFVKAFPRAIPVPDDPDVSYYPGGVYDTEASLKYEWSPASMTARQHSIINLSGIPFFHPDDVLIATRTTKYHPFPRGHDDMWDEFDELAKVDFRKIPVYLKNESEAPIILYIWKGFELDIPEHWDALTIDNHYEVTIATANSWHTTWTSYTELESDPGLYDAPYEREVVMPGWGWVHRNVVPLTPRRPYYSARNGSVISNLMLDNGVAELADADFGSADNFLRGQKVTVKPHVPFCEQEDYEYHMQYTSPSALTHSFFGYHTLGNGATLCPTVALRRNVQLPIRDPYADWRSIPQRIKDVLIDAAPDELVRADGSMMTRQEYYEETLRDWKWAEEGRRIVESELERRMRTTGFGGIAIDPRMSHTLWFFFMTSWPIILAFVYQILHHCFGLQFALFFPQYLALIPYYIETYPTTTYLVYLCLYLLRLIYHGLLSYLFCWIEPAFMRQYPSTPLQPAARVHIVAGRYKDGFCSLGACAYHMAMGNGLDYDIKNLLLSGRVPFVKVLYDSSDRYRLEAGPFDTDVKQPVMVLTYTPGQSVGHMQLGIYTPPGYNADDNDVVEDEIAEFIEDYKDALDDLYRFLHINYTSVDQPRFIENGMSSYRRMFSFYRVAYLPCSPESAELLVPAEKLTWLMSNKHKYGYNALFTGLTTNGKDHLTPSEASMLLDIYNIPQGDDDDKHVLNSRTGEPYCSPRSYFACLYAVFMIFLTSMVRLNPVESTLTLVSMLKNVTGFGAGENQEKKDGEKKTWLEKFIEQFYPGADTVDLDVAKKECDLAVTKGWKPGFTGYKPASLEAKISDATVPVKGAPSEASKSAPVSKGNPKPKATDVKPKPLKDTSQVACWKVENYINDVRKELKESVEELKKCFEKLDDTSSLAAISTSVEQVERNTKSLIASYATGISVDQTVLDPITGSIESSLNTSSSRMEKLVEQSTQSLQDQISECKEVLEEVKKAFSTDSSPRKDLALDASRTHSYTWLVADSKGSPQQIYRLSMPVYPQTSDAYLQESLGSFTQLLEKKILSTTTASAVGSMSKIQEVSTQGSDLLVSSQPSSLQDSRSTLSTLKDWISFISTAATTTSSSTTTTQPKTQSSKPSTTSDYLPELSKSQQNTGESNSSNRTTSKRMTAKRQRYTTPSEGWSVLPPANTTSLANKDGFGMALVSSLMLTTVVMYLSLGLWLTLAYVLLGAIFSWLSKHPTISLTTLVLLASLTVSTRSFLMAESDGGSTICTEWPLTGNWTWSDYYKNKTCAWKTWGVTQFKNGAIGKNATFDDLRLWNIGQKATALLLTRPLSRDPEVIDRMRIGWMVAEDILARAAGRPRPVFNMTLTEWYRLNVTKYGLQVSLLGSDFDQGFLNGVLAHKYDLDLNKMSQEPIKVSIEIDGIEYFQGHKIVSLDDLERELMGLFDEFDPNEDIVEVTLDDIPEEPTIVNQDDFLDASEEDDWGEDEDITLEKLSTDQCSISDDPGSEFDKTEMARNKKTQKTPTNNAPKMTKRQKKAERKLRRMRQGFRDVIAANKTVRAGVHYLPDMPEGSKAYVRSVLDPAHIKDYEPQGIPDPNTTPTLVSNLQVNYTLNLKPSKMFVKTADSTYAEVNITSGSLHYVYIIQTGDAAIGYFITYFGSFTDGSKTYDRGLAYNINNDLIKWLQSNENSGYRVITKGYTTHHVGPKMYRGGIWTGSVHSSTRVYNAGNDSSAPYIDLTDAENNQRFTTSTDGIYATLPIINSENSREWRSLDNANTLQVRWPDGETWNVSLPGTCYLDSGRNKPSHYASVVKYVPPAVMQLNATGLTDVNIVITVFTSVEKQMPGSQGGHNSVTADEAAFRLVAGLLENAPSYYPSSYNDWRKVLRQLKKFYKDNRAAIDTAAGFIPYGKTVVGVLDALTGGKSAN